MSGGGLHPPPTSASRGERAPAEPAASRGSAAADQDEREERPERETEPGSGARERAHRFRDRAFVAAIHGARRMLRALGVARSLRIADAIGRLLDLVLIGPRRLSLEHLELALPELPAAERRRIVRDMFRGVARSGVEVLLLDDIAARLSEHVDIEGGDVMADLLARGRGVVAITGHIGNWELLAAAVARVGFPVTAVATPVKGERLNAENIALRERVGVETIVQRGSESWRAILRTLRRGRILAAVMDQDTRGQAVFVPFFGRPARTPVGPAVLVLRTGAAALGAFIHREADGRHRVTLREIALPPLPPEGAREARDDWLVETTARFNAAIEAEVRRRPDEWVWWHRRWRERPSRIVGMRSRIGKSSNSQ